MTPPPLDFGTVADLFLQRNMIREATNFLLQVLNDAGVAVGQEEYCDYLFPDE